MTNRQTRNFVFLMAAVAMFVMAFSRAESVPKLTPEEAALEVSPYDFYSALLWELDGDRAVDSFTPDQLALAADMLSSAEYERDLSQRAAIKGDLVLELKSDFVGFLVVVDSQSGVLDVSWLEEGTAVWRRRYLADLELVERLKGILE